ncbi:MAG TPA: response regulator [Terriglobia bacterium]|nr:response regulator [Terriglobia bacterium]
MDVLYVEDEPQDREFTLRELTRRIQRERIAVARDGEEALDFLFGERSQNGGSLDGLKLVLLDLKLPKVDGIEVLREIRTRLETKLLPVVVMTSSAEERDLTTCYRLGANSYVQKPVSFERFQQVVQTLGLYWVEINQTLQKDFPPG